MRTWTSCFIQQSSINCFAYWQYLKSKVFVILDCEEPAAPTNGSVSVTNGKAFGAVVNYGCDTGFRLVGNASNVCGLAGQWEPGPPTCQLIGYLYTFDLLISISIIKTVFPNVSLIVVSQQIVVPFHPRRTEEYSSLTAQHSALL